MTIISNDNDNIIIHSPCIKYNCTLKKEGSVIVNFSTRIVKLGMELLYKYLEDYNESMSNMFRLFSMTDEDVGSVYFLFKELQVLSLQRIGEKFFESFFPTPTAKDSSSDSSDDISSYKSYALVSKFCEDIIIALNDENVRVLNEIDLEDEKISMELYFYIPHIVSLLLMNNLIHKAFLYDILPLSQIE